MANRLKSRDATLIIPTGRRQIRWLLTTWQLPTLMPNEYTLES